MSRHDANEREERQSTAIILRSQPYLEADRLVSFLCSQRGLLRGIARGVRRGRSAALASFELASFVEITYRPGRASDALVRITQCDLLPPHPLYGADYEMILLATYFVELVALQPVGPQEAAGFHALLRKMLLLGSQSSFEPAASHDALPHQNPTQQRAAQQGTAQQGTAQQKKLRQAWLRLRFEWGYLRLMGIEPGWLHCCRSGVPLFDFDERGVRPLHLVPHRFDLEAGGIFPLLDRPPLDGPPLDEPPLDGPPGNVLRGASSRLGRYLPRGDLSLSSLEFLAAWRLLGLPAARQATPAESIVREWEHVLRPHLLRHLPRRPRSLAFLPSF